MKHLAPLITLLFCLVGVDAHAERYLLPAKDKSIIGQLTIVSAQDADTFLDIARRFDIGYQELILANPGVDPWLPGEGAQIVVPTRYILPNAKRDGIVLNLAEMRLYYYSKHSQGEPKYVHTYPISIGRSGWDTPNSETRIIAKSENPTWYPPASIRQEHVEIGDPLPAAVPPGPDNPLGKFALHLALPGYLLHGTNEPRGIGMKVTHGCIRLHPDDIKDLFKRVSTNTRVTIINQPYKLAWHNDKLYTEAHPNEGDESMTKSRHLTQFVQAVIAATTSTKDYKIDWELANHSAKNKSGVPIVVGSKR